MHFSPSLGKEKCRCSDRFLALSRDRQVVPITLQIWRYVIVHLSALTGYILSVGCVSFAVCYKHGPLVEEMTPRSSVLVWRIPGTGELGGLQSMGLQRVGHD